MTPFKLKTLLVLLTLCVFTCAEAQWAQKTSLGSERDASIAFAIGGKIYCGGGYGKKDFWEYNPAANTWTAKADIPGVTSERGFGVGVAVGNKGYVGLGAANSSVVADWWEYDPATNTWAQKASYPVARDGCGYFVLNGNVYVFGGTDNVSVYDQCYAYDPAANTWTAKASYALGPICFPYAFAINGKGYVSGGAQSAEVTNTYEYDPATNTWTAKAAFPAAARQAGVSFVINNIAYCGLGHSNYTTPYNDFFSYNPVTNSWKTITNTGISARAWPTAAATTDKAYIGLGWDFSNTYKDWWEFTPPLTRISAVETHGTVMVFPSPFAEELTIDVGGFTTPCKVSIYTLQGAVLFEKTIPAGEAMAVNSSAWASGYYLLEAVSGNQTFTKKIMRQ